MPAEAGKAPFISTVKPVIDLISTLIIIFGTLFGGAVWLTGGFTLRNQAAIEDLNTKLNQLNSSVDKLNARIESLPRPSDYLAQEAHLSRIDTALRDLQDKAINGEASDRAQNDRILRLENATGARQK